MTSYEVIFNAFSQKITDFSLLDLSDSDLQQLLLGWLKSAIPKMRRCVSDLSNRDDEVQAFNDDLLDVEIEILACLMVVEWINPQLNSTMFTSQFFGGKEEKFYAQSNHLESIRSLKKDMQSEARKLRRDYATNTNSYLLD